MITELRREIFRIGTDNTDNTITEFYYLTPDESAECPYAIFFEITQLDDKDSGSRYIEIPFQISFYDNSPTPERLEQAEEAFYQAFNDQESSFDMMNYKAISIQREFSKALRSENGWMIISQYRIELEAL